MSCFLCINKKIRRNCLNQGPFSPPSFHKFPRNPQVRALWLQICGLDEKRDTISTLKICSNHFTCDDYNDLNAKKCGGKPKLKPNAVPFKSYLNKTDRAENKNRMDFETIMLPTLKLETSEFDVIHEIDDCAAIDDRVVIEFFNNENEPNYSETLNAPDDFIEDLNDLNNPAGPSTAKSRFQLPRYIGDLSYQHVETPKKACSTIKFIKETVKKKDLEIRTLKQRNYRLMKKLASLETLVEHLKTKQLFPDDEQDIL